jgi:aspartate kinase
MGFERDRGVTHLSVRDDVSHMGVHLPEPGVEMAGVFEVLADHAVNIYLVKLHEQMVNFAIDHQDLARATEALEAAEYEVTVEAECSVVSTVARSMRDMSGVMSRIIGCLIDDDIDVREFADSYNSVSCLVSASDRDSAVRALGEEFCVRVGRLGDEDPW